MQLSLNKVNHMLAVARKMQEEVDKNRSLYGITPEDAYVVGFLHDIGYLLVDNPKGHGKAGGEFLREQGNPNWKEVYYHGLVQDEYSSPLLDLLNKCDLTTGTKGEDLEPMERLEGIKERYGADSCQYKNSVTLAKQLGLLERRLQGAN